MCHDRHAGVAMAMVPEEFPVILTVFMPMGAWRLAKENPLVQKLPSVETLGAVSVLCVDNRPPDTCYYSPLTVPMYTPSL